MRETGESSLWFHRGVNESDDSAAIPFLRLLLLQRGDDLCTFAFKGGQTFNSFDCQMEAVELVQNGHVEGRSGRAFLDEAAHVEVRMVGAFVDQPVNEIRIAVIGEDHRTVAREDAVKYFIRDTVWMVLRRLQRHQVDDIDDADAQARQGLP